MRETYDELGKFFAAFLFCFLNSSKVTRVEWIRMQAAGFFLICFNIWMVFKKDRFANVVWGEINLPLS